MDHDRIREIVEGANGNQPLTARSAAPFLAGMIDGVFKNLFVPMTKSVAYQEFVHAEHPLVARVTLPDGTKLRVTIEAEEDL